MYSRAQKIDFIKEISKLEGGCIKLINNNYSDFQIKSVLHTGIIKDEIVATKKPYDMNMSDLPDDYIDYVFGEIDSMKYYSDDNFTNITKLVKNELGRVEFYDKINIINGNYAGYKINSLVLHKDVLSVELVSYNQHNELMHNPSIDIAYMDECVINEIQEKINNNKYL